MEGGGGRWRGRWRVRYGAKVFEPTEAAASAAFIASLLLLLLPLLLLGAIGHRYYMINRIDYYSIIESTDGAARTLL